MVEGVLQAEQLWPFFNARAKVAFEHPPVAPKKATVGLSAEVDDAI